MARPLRPDSPLPARQRRSQATLDRLLAAGEEALREVGAEGATLRAIAERAGVSPGIVYRRFPDKDTLLRAVTVQFLERATAANEEALRNAAWGALPSAGVLGRLVAGMAAGYRQHRPLLRALLLYARSHHDPDFRRRVEAANAPAFRAVTAHLATRASEIGHPISEAAVAFGMSAVGAVLQEEMLFSEEPPGEPAACEALVRELTLLLLRYLRIPEPPPGTAPDASS